MNRPAGFRQNAILHSNNNFKILAIREGLRRLAKDCFRRLGIFSLARHLEILRNAQIGFIHEPELRQLPLEVIGSGLVADVGANLGQSLISLRNLLPNSPIVAFEPNPSCAKTLAIVAKTVGNTRLELCGIGSSQAVLKFRVPVLKDGSCFLQEGSFDKTVFESSVTRKRIGGDFSLAVSNVPVRTLDSYDLNFALVKIDVQGFELEVLQGSVETIRRSRPVFFVERDSRTEDDIFSFLCTFGYRALKLSGNCIYLPTS